MQYVIIMLLVNYTEYVRIIKHVRNTIAIFMTLDHVHSENEIRFYIAHG
jgi:hypothetical protein